MQVWKLIGDKITHAPGFHSSLYIPYELSAIWVVIGMLSIAIGFYPALKMFDLVLLYPFVLVPLALVAAIWITRLFKAAKSLRVELEETAEESKTVKQLREMGFCEKLKVTKLSNGRNIICVTCGTKLVLNRKLADQVMVCPV